MQLNFTLFLKLLSQFPCDVYRHVRYVGCLVGLWGEVHACMVGFLDAWWFQWNLGFLLSSHHLSKFTWGSAFLYQLTSHCIHIIWCSPLHPRFTVYAPHPPSPLQFLALDLYPLLSEILNLLFVFLSFSLLFNKPQDYTRVNQYKVLDIIGHVSVVTK